RVIVGSGGGARSAANTTLYGLAVGGRAQSIVVPMATPPVADRGLGPIPSEGRPPRRSPGSRMTLGRAPVAPGHRSASRLRALSRSPAPAGASPGQSDGTGVDWSTALCAFRNKDVPGARFVTGGLVRAQTERAAACPE